MAEARIDCRRMQPGLGAVRREATGRQRRLTTERLILPFVLHGPVAELAQACGARFMILPPCSPGLDPIGMQFVEPKALPHEAEYRPRGVLWRTIADLTIVLTPDAGAHHIRHEAQAS